MQVAGEIIVVTSSSNGVGRALCNGIRRAGAAKVVVVDIDPASARAPSQLFPMVGPTFKCNVGKEKDIFTSSRRPSIEYGPIAPVCSNAGIGGGLDPLSVNAGGASDEPWSRSWAIHVMADVYAARH